jgi:hypothetical protein
MLLSKERKSNEMYYGESVDCNIIMAINIMEKTRHLFSVVLRGCVGLGISQDTFKGGCC